MINTPSSTTCEENSVRNAVGNSISQIEEKATYSLDTGSKQSSVKYYQNNKERRPEKST